MNFGSFRIFSGKSWIYIWFYIFGMIIAIIPFYFIVAIVNFRFWIKSIRIKRIRWCTTLASSKDRGCGRSARARS